MTRAVPDNSPPIVVPATFLELVVGNFGDEGRRWAATLPTLIDEFCATWELVPRADEFTLSINFVLPAERRDGTPAVLKLGVPQPDLLQELNALAIYDGDGMCRLLESAPDRGVMLLERVKPGATLLGVGETPAAISAAASVMRRLRKAPSDRYPLPPLVEAWRTARAGLKAATGGGGPFPPGYLDDAEAIYTELFADRTRHVVLHGDHHHWNIFSSGHEGWLAIDPHGYTGPPECEVGAFMINPNDGALVRPDIRAVLARRLDQFSDELGFERETLRMGSFAYAMLSSVWSAEDGGDRWRPAFELARVLRDC